MCRAEKYLLASSTPTPSRQKGSGSTVPDQAGTGASGASAHNQGPRASASPRASPDERASASGASAHNQGPGTSANSPVSYCAHNQGPRASANASPPASPDERAGTPTVVSPCAFATGGAGGRG